MRFHFSRSMMNGGLEIYAVSENETVQLTVETVQDGVVTIREQELPEGVLPNPFLRLSGLYAQAFEEGFKRFLGERDHIVPKDVYEREARRVDKLLDAIVYMPAKILNDRFQAQEE